MANFFQTVREWFSTAQTLPVGMYHFISPNDDPRNYRLHLRVEPDGSGLLIINASTILHLNQTAAEYAYSIIQNQTPAETARRMAGRYLVTKEQAIEDYQKLIDQIQILINTPDLDPETFLGFERKEAHLTRLSAPYRLDCALTYRLPGDQQPESAPLERVKRELSTAEWIALIDKAFAAGIPHIVFTGGEPTLRDDLAELIGHVEANGQVAGLITNGQRLNEPGYLEQILTKGLDHLMVVLKPEDSVAWMIVENILAADIFLAVHLTLTPENTKELPGVIDRLAAMGVRAISLSSNHPELKNELENARNLVAAHQVELVWNLPVPYSALHPIAMETTEWSSLPGAGKHWLYVEPDGDVLPAQGLNQVIGNLAQQTWQAVWKQ